MAVTLDPVNVGSTITLSGGLTATTSTSGAWGVARTTNTHASPDFVYNEFKIISGGGGAEALGVGFIDATGSVNNYLGSDTHSIGWYNPGDIFANAGVLATIASFNTANTYLGVAQNFNTGKFWLTVDGTTWGPGSGTPSPITGVGGGTLLSGALYAALALNSNNGGTCQIIANFTGPFNHSSAFTSLQGVGCSAWDSGSGSPYTLAGSTGAFSISGKTGAFVHGYKLAGAQGAYSISGKAAGLAFNRKLAGSLGTFAISGKTAGLIHGYNLAGAQGTYSISGKNAGMLHAYSLPGSQGTYAISGNTGAFVYNHLATYPLAGATGTFSLSGKNATMAVGRKLAGAQGAYAISGQVGTLIRGRHLAGSQGTYSLSGKASVLTFNRKLLGTTGAYVISGKVADLTFSGGDLRLDGSTGHYSITGHDALMTRHFRRFNTFALAVGA